MTGLPVPPEAVEAAAKASGMPLPLDERRHFARQMLTAAAPFLLAQARAEGAAAERAAIVGQVDEFIRAADVIERAEIEPSSDYWRGRREGQAHIAAVLRREAPSDALAAHDEEVRQDERRKIAAEIDKLRDAELMKRDVKEIGSGEGCGAHCAECHAVAAITAYGLAAYFVAARGRDAEPESVPEQVQRAERERIARIMAGRDAEGGQTQ